MSENLMLKFYRTHNIVPVEQKIKDMNFHFHRRRLLYQQLGIYESLFNGKRILEIGPGTGQNSLYVRSLNPKELVLIDACPTAIGWLRELYPNCNSPDGVVKIKNLEIEHFVDSNKFDLVLCEGLALDHNLAKMAARNVKRNGILVLTCVDYVSYFSEQIRRLLAIDLVDRNLSLQAKAEILEGVFKKHLDSLSGMSRKYLDWVIDVLINPASIGKLFSLAECISSLSKWFDVISTSPRFITDWAWYKNAAQQKDFFNSISLESYWNNLHNFLDYRYTYPLRSKNENARLMNSCELIHTLIRDYENHPDTRLKNEIVNELKNLRNQFTPEMGPVDNAINEAISWLVSDKLSSANISASNIFGSWFGRGQTYVSLLCRDEVN